MFIGGPDRCGKTTMRAFLTSHPNISIPAVGSNMWTYFYDRYGDLRDRSNFERCLDAMLHYKHVKFLKPDGDRIRREFLEGEPTYARLFALFQQHHAERAGKPRWGDQTGLVERYADLIFAAYSGARMIHMIRDPRDRYEASLSLWPSGKGRAGGAAARWLYSVRLAKRNLLRHPDRYKLVRFEDLILRTESTVREVCRFLGEDFTPEMLEIEGDQRFREGLRSRANSKVGAPLLSPEFIGQFRGRLSRREILFLQTQARREMQELGYQPEPVRLAIREWLAYSVFDFPANLLRKAAWQAREAAQQKFPRWVRRPIGARMLVQGD